MQGGRLSQGQGNFFVFTFGTILLLLLLLLLLFCPIKRKPGKGSISNKRRCNEDPSFELQNYYQHNRYVTSLSFDGVDPYTCPHMSVFAERSVKKDYIPSKVNWARK